MLPGSYEVTAKHWQDLARLMLAKRLPGTDLVALINGDLAGVITDEEYDERISQLAAIYGRG